MKKILLSLFFLFSVVHADKEYLFNPIGRFTRTDEYTQYGLYLRSYLSKMNVSRFEVKDEQTDQIVAEVEKPNSWTREYNLVENGKVVAHHQAFFVSMGCLMDSMKDFLVQGEDGESLGRICGAWLTDGAAEFYFYDADGAHFATAYLVKNYSRLVIQDAMGNFVWEADKVFKWHKKYSSIRLPPRGWVEYEWNVTEMDDNSVDPRFVWPFLSFISEVWWQNETPYRS